MMWNENFVNGVQNSRREYVSWLKQIKKFNSWSQDVNETNFQFHFTRMEKISKNQLLDMSQKGQFLLCARIYVKLWIVIRWVPFSSKRIGYSFLGNQTD